MLTLWIAAALGAVNEGLTDEEATARKRLKGKTVAAWVYGGAIESTPPKGKQYVAADIRLKRFSDAIILHNVEAIDPKTDRAFGGPQYACLDDEGARIDCEGQGERDMTVRFVWTVTEGTEKLGFELWGRKLSKKAKIGPSGPTLPRRSQ